MNTSPATRSNTPRSWWPNSSLRFVAYSRFRSPAVLSPNATIPQFAKSSGATIVSYRLVATDNAVHVLTVFRGERLFPKGVA